MSPAALEIKLLSVADLADTPPPPAVWLWEPVLAYGAVTLFTSRWKAGKTTLTSVLLTRLTAGGELAGATVRPASAVVVSEEGTNVWAARHRVLGFGNRTGFVCRPFRGPPSMKEWLGLIDRLVADRPDLVVIDPLASVLPSGVENSPASLLKFLDPLRRLTDLGAAVMLLHHPRKGGAADKLSPRGTGALTAYADVLVELDRPRGDDPGGRRRRLRTNSRFAGPSTRVIELNEAGTDYAAVPDPEADDDFSAGWPVLKGVLDDTPYRMTREQILGGWPKDHPKPNPRTLLRWLTRAEEGRKVVKRGKGRRFSPFLYTLRHKKDLLPDLPEIDPSPVDPPTESERVAWEVAKRKLLLEADVAAERLQLKWLRDHEED